MKCTPKYGKDIRGKMSEFVVKIATNKYKISINLTEIVWWNFYTVEMFHENRILYSWMYLLY